MRRFVLMVARAAIVGMSMVLLVTTPSFASTDSAEDKAESHFASSSYCVNTNPQGCAALFNNEDNGGEGVGNTNRAEDKAERHFVSSNYCVNKNPQGCNAFFSFEENGEGPTADS